MQATIFLISWQLGKFSEETKNIERGEMKEERENERLRERGIIEIQKKKRESRRGREKMDRESE